MLFLIISSKEMNISKIGKWFHKLCHIPTIGYHKAVNYVFKNTEWCKQMAIT